MKLPRGYLSFSQFNLWKKSKTQYAKRYFEGKKGFETKEIRFGKMVHENPAKYGFTELQNNEYGLECEVKGVPLYGIIDSCEPSLCEIVEYKTGKNKPNPEDQLKFYAVMINEITGNIPRCSWEWAETDETVDGEIAITGELEIYLVKFSKKEIEEFKKEIVKVAKEISEAWENYKKQDVDEDLAQEYARISSEIKHLQEEQSKLKELVAQELEANKLDSYSTESGTFFFTTRKKYNYPTEFLEEEKKFKKLKKEIESKCEFEESKSLSFRF